MERKRVTELFPQLIPLRRKQRKLFFYAGMRLDSNRYASLQAAQPYPHLCAESSSVLYNTETGFDMVYQQNKVHNLKLAAQKLDGLVIQPGESFSFWQAVRHADAAVPYKDGLVVVHGKLTAAYGGGLCQLSNLLFWLILHTPLTILERHGHRIKDFPEPNSQAPKGVDATVSEGWLDLKCRNDTKMCYQICLCFAGDALKGSIRADTAPSYRYEVVNGSTEYLQAGQEIRERASVVRRKRHATTGEVVGQALLYTNECAIGYPLPEGTPVRAFAQAGEGRV